MPQRRRRGGQSIAEVNEATHERQPRHHDRGPSRSTSRSRVASWLCVSAVLGLLLLWLRPSSGAPTPLKPPLRVVPLFIKPDTPTGQLVAAQEGLDVLRRQSEPFAIVTAVGPTRTGKSSILGRAFLRGRNENAFEVGSGVTSYTTGVWITSEPVLLTPAGGGAPIRVLLIDTEGFGGVGGVTSRTYEANLFGITYLLSSAMIFNTMYPVDASTVDRMNA